MAVLTLEEVATAFIESYYFHIFQSPKDVHKFYKESSKLNWLGPDRVLNHWTITEAIDNHVVYFFGCKELVIFSIDVQLSKGFGVLVMVIGCMIMENNTRRKFIQSFFLVPINKPKAYFILNDILRFLDEEQTSKACVQGVDSTPISVDISPKKAVQEIEKDAAVAAASRPKKSFRNTVNALNENNAPFKAAPIRKSVPTTTKESKGKSVFVGNIEFLQAFNKFEAIKINWIKTRSDITKNGCFAFTEFESSSSAPSAIQASSITFGNFKGYTQEKKIRYANTGTASFHQLPALVMAIDRKDLFTRRNRPVN